MDTMLDRAAPVPLYQQLRELLRGQIQSGVWSEGEALPTEVELCDMHGVSRTTARAAIDDLVRERLIYREQGRGTFVVHRPTSETLVQSLRGFYHDMTARGYNVTSEILAQEVYPASEKVSQFLQIPVGITVVGLTRIRKLNGDPVCYTTGFVPYALSPGVLTADFRNQSLYDYIVQTYGFRPVRASRTVEAKPMPTEIGSLLDQPEGNPALYVESVARLSDGTPLEFNEAWHRGDKTKFEVEVVAEESV